MDDFDQALAAAYHEANLKAANLLVKALEEIAAMDPKGIRADDLGRAARIAAEALARHVGQTLGNRND